MDAAVIDNPRDLARAVRAARREVGLTQDDLALASGTGRSFIIDLEAGKATVRLDSVLAVLASLGLRVELHRGRGFAASDPPPSGSPPAGPPPSDPPSGPATPPPGAPRAGA